MPRLKATSFIGAPLRDCVPNSPIYSRTIKRAAAETAAVFDKLTGSNSETATINHSGDGRGCPINPVIVNNYINHSYNVIGPTSYHGDYSIVACPVYIPKGQFVGMPIYVKAVFEGYMSASGPPFVVIMDPTETEVVNTQMQLELRTGGNAANPNSPSASDRFIYRTKSIFVGSGLHYFFIRAYSDDDVRKIISWHVEFDRSHSNVESTLQATTNEEESAAHTTLTPSTWVDFYDGHFPENGGLDSWVLTRLNRNQGALWEYLTGAKIDGNQNYKCETLRNHNQANFANEPNLAFPICTQATSGIYYNALQAKPPVNNMGTLAPTEGMLFHSRWPINQPSTASPATFASNVLYMPSFNYLANKLRCSVIIANTDNSTSLSNWRVRVVGIDTSAYASFVHLFAHYYIATIDGIAFDADSPNQFNLQIAHTSPGALSQRCVITGYCFYFLP